MRIDERITRHHDHLSPQEQRAAATLLEHLDELATYRAAELAELAGVSKATMSRLFRSLGFADFDEVRSHLRSLRVAGEPRRADGSDGAPDLAAHVAAQADALRRAVDQPGLAAAVAAVADARRVLVVGWRNSHPVALHLRQQLVQARPDVRLAPVPGQTLGEELVDLGPGDTVVAVGFRRRPSGFTAFVDEVVAGGATLVLLADPSALPLAGRSTVWLECPVASTLAFDSYAAAMGLVGVLADGVLRRRGGVDAERAGVISGAYARLDELEA